MAQVFSQSVTIAVGTRVFGPFNVPDDLSTATIRLSNWSQTGRTLAFQLDIDAGDGFQQFVNMNPTPGARPIGRDGTRDASVVVGPLPDVAGRRARVTTTVAGGSVTTTVTMTVT